MEVDLLSGAENRRGSATGDFSWLCQGLVVISIVYKPRTLVGLAKSSFGGWRVDEPQKGG